MKMFQNKPIGDLLVELRATTSDIVARASAIQKDTGERLGAILVRLGLIDQEKLDTALSVQSDLRSPLRRKWLGEHLVDMGVATTDAINKAIEHQKKTGRRLGEALMEPGIASEKAITGAIQKQKEEASSVGNLLVRMGVVNEAQLSYALKVQSNSGGRIGDTLVELGHIDEDALNQALGLQKLVRRGISIALVSAAISAATAGTASAATQGDMSVESSATSTISVVIPERASINIGSGGAGGADGGGSQIAVEGGQVDMSFNGPSYLKGATTVSATGMGADGEFVLQDASGEKVGFSLTSADDAENGGIAPNQNIQLADIGNLSIDFPQGGDKTGGTGNVYFGVVTLMVSPQ
jgi:hypothetical protein